MNYCDLEKMIVDAKSKSDALERLSKEVNDALTIPADRVAAFVLDDPRSSLVIDRGLNTTRRIVQLGLEAFVAERTAEIRMILGVYSEDDE